jgi:hypothetical protein
MIPTVDRFLKKKSSLMSCHFAIGFQFYGFLLAEEMPPHQPRSAIKVLSDFAHFCVADNGYKYEVRNKSGCVSVAPACEYLAASASLRCDERREDGVAEDATQALQPDEFLSKDLQQTGPNVEYEVKIEA